MEDLNKTQIILLALLVSFVSSVATSIMTYSLLVEVPPAVTQTVNRVVERTIETVVPAETEPNVVTREVTVVVQEEDLVVDAIAKNEVSLVRIWQKSGNGNDSQRTFYGTGIILSKEGLIAAGRSEIIPGSSLEVVFSDGSTAVLNTAPSASEHFSFFRAQGKSDLKASVLGDSSILQLGQSVIAIKGQERNTVSIGRITGLVKKETQAEGETSAYSLVETDFVLGEGVKGGPVVNLKGDFVGFNVSGQSNFIPINTLKDDVTKVS